MPEQHVVAADLQSLMDNPAYDNAMFWL